MPAAALSCRLLALRKMRELTQDFGGPGQAVLRCFPILEEHHLHVRSDPRCLAVLADEGAQPIRLRKTVVAEGDHRALRPRIDLLDIGTAAIGLDRGDLEEI